MGMAASQVRFLSLQNRKNTIGLNLMTLANRKTALSRDMNRVAAEYNNAMNQKLLKWSGDSGVSYHDIDYDTLMKPNNLNATLPYIVTDAQGRVVVDDNNIIIDGADTGVSYRQLATMISTYSSVDSNTSLALYDNTDRVSGLTGAPVTRDNNKKITDIGKAEYGQSSSKEYDIMSNFDNYNFMNSMRYDLMTKLGLITETDKNEHTALLNDIYGSPEILDKTAKDYAGALKDFDNDSTAATAKYDKKYEEIFGSLGTDPQDPEKLVLTGGCAMGRLALAKAYQKEYQAYLRTPVEHNLKGDKNIDLGTKNARTMNYNETAQNGISNRMLDFLSDKRDITTDANGNYQLTTHGILDSLQFTSGTKQVSNYWDSDLLKNILRTAAEADDNDKDRCGALVYAETPDKYIASHGSVRPEFKNITWADLYDMDAKPNDGSSGCFLVLDWYYEATNGSDRTTERKQHMIETKLKGVIKNFSDSLKSAWPLNEAALNYASEKTLEVYRRSDKINDVDNFDLEKGDGYKNGGNATCSAAGACGMDKFQFGVADDMGGEPDPIVIYIPNLMQVFFTFYSMYEAVGGDKDLLTSKGDKTYSSQIRYMANLSPSQEKILSDMRSGTAYTMGNIWDSIKKSYNNTDDELNGPKAVNDTTDEYTLKAKGEDGIPTGDDAVVITVTYSDEKKKEITKITVEEYEQRNEENPNTPTKTFCSTTTYEVNGNNIKETNKNGNTYTYSSNNKGEVYIESGDNNITLNSSGEIIKINGNGDQGHLNNQKQTDVTAAYYIGKDGIADEDYKNLYYISMDGKSRSYLVTTLTLYPEDKYSSQIDKLVQSCQDEVNQLMAELKRKYAALESRGMDYFDAIFKMIAENGWVYDGNVNNPANKENSKNYLNAKLQNNMYFITEVDTLDGQDFNYATKLAMNVSKVFQVYDTDAQNVALSKYESEKADITAKEKVIDIRMNKLEAEQDAISTELDSIKQIIKDNVDKTFKIFT